MLFIIRYVARLRFLKKRWNASKVRFDHPVVPSTELCDLVIERLSTFRPSLLLVPLSTSFSQPVHSKTRLFFPSFQARKLTDATTRAQLTEKQAVWIDLANVSARLNTATGEISRNLGAIERGAGAILCDRGGWPISLQPTRQLYVSVG